MPSNILTAATSGSRVGYSNGNLSSPFGAMNPNNFSRGGNLSEIYTTAAYPGEVVVRHSGNQSSGLAGTVLMIATVSHAMTFGPSYDEDENITTTRFARATPFSNGVAYSGMDIVVGEEISAGTGGSVAFAVAEAFGFAANEAEVAEEATLTIPETGSNVVTLQD